VQALKICAGARRICRTEGAALIKSKVLQKLRGGDIVRVAGVGRVTEPWFTEVAGRLGFDLIWLDFEHRPFSNTIIDPISLACRATGMDLMVRIRKAGYFSALQPLESGAHAIMVPHIRSVEEARQWVEWTYFFPLGNRGFDNAGVDADYGLSDAVASMKARNEETFLVLQIEDRQAVECVEDIAGLEGVQILFVGPADLTISYGVPLQVNSPVVQKAIDRVANAAAKAGKWWGMLTATPEDAQKALDRGARVVTCVFDHSLLVHGLRKAYQDFSQIKI
jgi:4-hydroxy-2-oxoheptanedioate aldolase